MNRLLCGSRSQGLLLRKDSQQGHSKKAESEDDRILNELSEDFYRKCSIGEYEGMMDARTDSNEQLGGIISSESRKKVIVYKSRNSRVVMTASSAFIIGTFCANSPNRFMHGLCGNLCSPSPEIHPEAAPPLQSH